MPIQKVLNEGKVPVKIWTKDIEEEAIRQLLELSSLSFLFKHVAVMPDVHPGKGSTIGTVIATKDVIIPSAIGVDIGCGMAAVLTPYHKDQIINILPEIRHLIEGDVPVGFNQHNNTLLAEKPELEDLWDDFEKNIVEGIKSLILKVQVQLGTLGGGNHFIEISVDEEDRVWIILHSGSRNIGKTIADIHIKKAQDLMEKYHISIPNKDLAYFNVDDELGKQYLHDMFWAQKYALQNRKLMLHLIIKKLAYSIEKKDYFHPLIEINCHHNYCELENHFGQNVFVTRKGAIRARIGDLGIIPGSMGAKSYIVEGLGEKDSFNSASHGAGRKYSRTEAKKRFTIDDLEKQTKGVECRKDEKIIDEVPAAYKNIDMVMENEKDLINPLHVLKQLVCIKG